VRRRYVWKALGKAGSLRASASIPGGGGADCVLEPQGQIWAGRPKALKKFEI
jgi:hypothetical protein